MSKKRTDNQSQSKNQKQSLNQKQKKFKDLAWWTAWYSSVSILGPLALFGLVGFLLDKYFGTKPVFLFISIGGAFLLTNVLLFRKVKKIAEIMERVNKR